jgi:hypothetical protein
VVLNIACRIGSKALNLPATEGGRRLGPGEARQNKRCNPPLDQINSAIRPTMNSLRRYSRDEIAVVNGGMGSCNSLVFILMPFH